MSIFNYACDEVDILVAGFIPVEGLFDGTFVNIKKDILPFTARRTPDGSVARVHHRDLTYTITITLHSGSTSNDLFTKLWQLDEISQRGKFPLIIKDQSGTDLFASSTTWIESPPEIIKSTSVEARSWILRSSQAVINIGSNEDASSIIEDIFNSTISSIPGLQNIL